MGCNFCKHKRTEADTIDTTSTLYPATIVIDDEEGKEDTKTPIYMLEIDLLAKQDPIKPLNTISDGEMRLQTLLEFEVKSLPTGEIQGHRYIIEQQVNKPKWTTAIVKASHMPLYPHSGTAWHKIVSHIQAKQLLCENLLDASLWLETWAQAARGDATDAINNLSRNLLWKCFISGSNLNRQDLERMRFFCVISPRHCGNRMPILGDVHMWFPVHNQWSHLNHYGYSDGRDWAETDVIIACSFLQPIVFDKEKQCNVILHWSKAPHVTWYNETTKQFLPRQKLRGPIGRSLMHMYYKFGNTAKSIFPELAPIGDIVDKEVLIEMLKEKIDQWEYADDAMKYYCAGDVNQFIYKPIATTIEYAEKLYSKHVSFDESLRDVNAALKPYTPRNFQNLAMQSEMHALTMDLMRRSMKSENAVSLPLFPSIIITDSKQENGETLYCVRSNMTMRTTRFTPKHWFTRKQLDQVVQNPDEMVRSYQAAKFASKEEIITKVLEPFIPGEDKKEDKQPEPKEVELDGMDGLL